MNQLINVLLDDVDHITTRPLSRLQSIFSVRNGVFSPLERIRHQYSSAAIYFRHPDLQYEKTIASVEGINAISDSKLTDKDFAVVLTSQSLLPFKILNEIAETLKSDLGYLSLDDYSNTAFTVVGDDTDLFIHKTATVHPGVIFDTRDGIIIIDANVIISPFSYISGPIYVGKNSRLDNLKVSGGCIIGDEVRLGGEVENTIMGSYSNKHHEGFVGHSVIGNWVNLGALTTTSDLKNNYGEVKINLPSSFLPTSRYSEELVTIPTSTIKFGSIIGDCVKTAIGTLLNTGTVIDCGCNIFGTKVEKYMPPFSWGGSDKRYQAERFYLDCEKIFARRNQQPNELLKVLSARILNRLID